MEFLVLAVMGSYLGCWYLAVTRPRASMPRPMAEPAPAPVPRRVQRAPDVPRGGWDHLVGRRIEAVVLTTRDKPAGNTYQAFFVLEGDVHFEIFSMDGFQGTQRLYAGGLCELLHRTPLGSEVRVFGNVPAPRR